MGKGMCEWDGGGGGDGFSSWSSFREIRQVRAFFVLPQSSGFCSPVTPEHTGTLLPIPARRRDPLPSRVQGYQAGLCPKYWKVTNHWFK